MKCLTCNNTSKINDFCEGCYNDLCAGGDDATQIAEKLVVQLTEATRLLEVAHDRIALLEDAHNDGVERNAALAGTLAIREQRIAKLEQQLAATLTAIDCAISDGALYSEGCTP